MCLGYNGPMVLLKNKRAFADYKLEKEFVAGVALTGGEVKSLRAKSGSLTGSFVKILSNEAFLVNAQVTPYKFADNTEYDPKRTRKLLLRRRELTELVTITQSQCRTLVPMQFEALVGKIKLRLAAGRGMKEYEKRERIKKREWEREKGEM